MIRFFAIPIAFVLSLTALASAEAGAIDTARIPATAEGVIHLDIEAARRSNLVQNVVGNGIGSALPEIAGALSKEFSPLTVDSFATSRSLTIWVRNWDKQRGAFILEPRSTADFAKVIAKAPKEKLKVRNGHRILVWRMDGDDAFAAVHKGLVVVSDNIEDVLTSLAVLDRKQKSLQNSAKAKAILREKGAFVAAVFGSKMLQKINDEAQASLLKVPVRGLAAVAGERGKSLFARVRIDMGTVADRERAQKAAEGLLALAALAGEDEALELIQKGLKLTASGRFLDVRLTVAADAAARLLK